MSSGRGKRARLVVLITAGLALAIGGPVVAGASSPSPVPVHRAAAERATGLGIHKIKHVVIIMQENRSFDSYFGTYPGADGIPGLAGNPGRVPCVSDPQAGHCRRPYHDSSPVNYGGPHGAADSVADIHG